MTPIPTPAPPLRRRASRRALALVGCLLLASIAGVVALLLRSHGGGATTEVAVVATRAAGVPATTLESVTLTGPGDADLGVSASALPTAPATSDLGVARVAARAYTGLRVGLAGHIIDLAAPAALSDGRLHPLLIVVAAHGVEAHWGNEAVNDGLAAAAGRLPRLPDATFTDQSGRTVTTASLRGTTVVLAALDTNCSDVCPLYTAVLQDLRRVLAARGLDGKVVIADVSMDPERDTPAELSAYAARFGAPWELLAADPVATARFWSALHASYVKLPATPGQVDWYTGKQSLYHLHHDSVALVVDADGNVRADLQGIPRLGHALTPALESQLAPDARQATQETLASWSLTDLLDRLDTSLGQPAEADRGVEHAARIGHRAPDFSLPTLGGPALALHDEVGHPVVVNFFASWCEPCTRELPLLAAGAARHPEVSLLLLDQGEGAADVHRFLDGVLGAGARVAAVLLDGDRSVGGDYAATGLPVTVFIDSDGVVRATHVGQLDDAALQAGLSTIG